MEFPSFDEMAELAKNNPEKLEVLRQQLIDQIIEQAPEDYHRRLRGLQFQIDAQRQIAPNPMAACLKISKMMHDSLADLRSFLQPDDMQGMMQQVVEASDSKAAILPFRGGALAN